MSQMLTTTALPVYQGLFEYRIARENMREFYGVTLFNGRKYTKAVITDDRIKLFCGDMCMTCIARYVF